MLTFLALPAMAVLQKQNIEYAGADQARLESYLAFEDTGAQKKPAILIVPDWMGLGDFAKNKAEELAKMGYVALAVDVYGKGVRPQNQQEASQFADKYRDGDRQVLRQRMQAAFDSVQGLNNVDPKKIIVIGYCFGGTAALELARSGTPVAATAAFHGGLNTPNAADAKKIKAPVLVMHGADDPYVPAAEVEAFKKEMKDAGVKLEFIAYKGAVHSFTIPDAGNDNTKGAAYNAAADKKSWADFKKFLKKSKLSI